MALKRVGIRDVADKAGVSVGTASMALNGHDGVSDRAKEAVLQAAQDLGYVPNLIGKALNRKKCGVIGVVVPVACEPLFPQILSGINDQAEDKGLPLFVSYSRDVTALESRALKMFSHLHVDGVVLATISGKENLSLVNDLMARGTPVIQVERKAENLTADYVGSDNRQAAYDQVRKLLAKGYRKVGIVRGPIDHSTDRERYEGYLKAMKEGGIDPPPEWSFNLSKEVEVKEGKEIYDLLRHSSRPDAFLWCTSHLSDLSAVLTRLGLQNGRDIDIVLFDGESSLDLHSQRFTNLMQNSYRIGEMAAECLFHRITEANSTVAPTPVREIRLPCVEANISGVVTKQEA
jgi:DNA-binding LacI/PurR family transcriptional regulator